MINKLNTLYNFLKKSGNDEETKALEEMRRNLEEGLRNPHRFDLEREKRRIDETEELLYPGEDDEMHAHYGDWDKISDPMARKIHRLYNSKNEEDREMALFLLENLESDEGENYNISALDKGRDLNKFIKENRPATFTLLETLGIPPNFVKDFKNNDYGLIPANISTLEDEGPERVRQTHFKYIDSDIFDKNGQIEIDGFSRENFGSSFDEFGDWNYDRIERPGLDFNLTYNNPEFSRSITVSIIYPWWRKWITERYRYKGDSEYQMKNMKGSVLDVSEQIISVQMNHRTVAYNPPQSPFPNRFKDENQYCAFKKSIKNNYFKKDKGIGIGENMTELTDIIREFFMHGNMPEEYCKKEPAATPGPWRGPSGDPAEPGPRKKSRPPILIKPKMFKRKRKLRKSKKKP